MNTSKEKKIDQKLNSKDLISIGIFAAITLTIFFVVGGIVSLSVIGTIFNIPITVFFTAPVYMLLAVKIRKRGIFFILGTINVLPGLMAANVIGVGGSIIGWMIAEVIVNWSHYSKKSIMILAYMVGSTLHSALFTAPMFLSNGEYLYARQEVLHLTDAAIQEYLKYYNWNIWGIAVILTLLSSFMGAWMGTKILNKHFKKAGLIK